MNTAIDKTVPRRAGTAAIVSKNNGYGLSVDAAILADALQQIGISSDIVKPGKLGHLARWLERRRYDLVLHLERVHPSWLHAGTKNILVPNQERFPHRHLRRLGEIDLVLAKTSHAEAIFADLGCRSVHVGFSSRDLREATVGKDWRKFLHIAGGSTLKGTEDILSLWEKHPEWPTLQLVQKQANLPASLPANVHVRSGYISDRELQDLMNGSGIHLCPSRSEGWGHYIHEAQACGAIVVTTDAPPMNEFVDAQTGFLVDVARREKRHLGTNFFIDPTSLEAVIETILAADPEMLAGKGENARQAFLRNMEAFPPRLSTALFD